MVNLQLAAYDSVMGDRSGPRVRALASRLLGESYHPHLTSPSGSGAVE
jgi:hypothetical protein